MEGNLMAARAVGLATTGASLPPVASHASVAASAYHPPRGLLSIAASAARAEVETDRFSNLIACGVICVAMTAPRPRGGPLVTTDQAPHRARSMRRRSSHIFSGVMRNRHPYQFVHHTLIRFATNLIKFVT